MLRLYGRRAGVEVVDGMGLGDVVIILGNRDGVGWGFHSTG